MTANRVRAGFAPLLVFCAALFLPAAPFQRPQVMPAAAGSEVVLTLDPAHSSVHWTVDTTLHMVHGTFALKNGTLHFDPVTGKAGGEIVVFAPSGESGNGSRDKRMHKEILESAKYPEVIFRPTQIEGTVERPGISDVKISGVFSIHGADHDLTASMHSEINGDLWRGTGRFEVPYVTWGIKDPSNFLLKVKPVVNIELEMSGEIRMSN